jgi:MFS transporter, DHA1 family, multidrug resistance protein
MTAVMACCALGALTISTLGKKLRIKQASIEKVEEEDVDMISTL